MKKTLRPYQKEILDEILVKLKIHNSLCVQLSTGGGKTVIFTELVATLNAKTLILVDSIDLVNQTIDTFKKQGLDVGCVLAGCKKIPDNKVIVAMVKSLWNRRKKIPKFDYCVIDECHVWEQTKLFEFLPNCKRIGFTATPVRLKRHKIDEMYSEIETMNQWYEEIICGKPISWLMNQGYLVRENTEYIDFDSSGLKTDASGEFTATSLKAVFESEDYKTALKKTFDNLCDGKKTMIFTASTETNRVYLELFKDKNAKIYDSKSTDENRHEIVDWFRNTKDAVLINTGCFTKGFDVDDVEVILMARATKSLSLWIQIAGRGARTTKKIEKPFFTLIDGGNNDETHLAFSFDRDWRKIFFDKQRKTYLIEEIDCEECGFIFPKKDKICPNCGWSEPTPEEIEEDEKPKEKKEFKIKGKKSKPQIPVLDLNFHIEKGHTKYQVIKTLKNKWITFLCKLNITKNHFLIHERKGNFNTKFKKLLFPLYLQIIKSILKDGKRVKYDTLTNNILKETKIKKYEI